MAIGDQNDMAARIRAVIPAGWLPAPSADGTSTTPIADAALAGLGWMWSWAYSLLAYVKLQARVSTATDIFLDLCALDFTGDSVQRRTQESDASFRSRVLAGILPAAGTRAALISRLTELTGRAPVVFEPQQPQDTGAYGYGGLGYNTAGGYGSLLLPFQAFITAYRPVSQGVPNLAGYSGNDLSPVYAPLGYGTGLGSYVDITQAFDGVTDNDIYRTVSDVEPAGSIVWTRITS